MKFFLLLLFVSIKLHCCSICCVGKKQQKFFVGRVMEVNEDEDEVKTIFMRRLPAKGNFVFVFPEADDICEHDIQDIMLKLPVPVSVGRTARSSRQFKFPCSLFTPFGADIQ